MNPKPVKRAVRVMARPMYHCFGGRRSGKARTWSSRLPGVTTPSVSGGSSRRSGMAPVRMAASELMLTSLDGGVLQVRQVGDGGLDAELLEDLEAAVGLHELGHLAVGILQVAEDDGV